MLNLRDRISLCRCFDGAASPERGPHCPDRPASSHHAPGAPAVNETAPFLRPGVDCMERWLDLNA